MFTLTVDDLDMAAVDEFYCVELKYESLTTTFSFSFALDDWTTGVALDEEHAAIAQGQSNGPETLIEMEVRQGKLTITYSGDPGEVTSTHQLDEAGISSFRDCVGRVKKLMAKEEDKEEDKE
jgi:hypothetical protein